MNVRIAGREYVRVADRAGVAPGETVVVRAGRYEVAIFNLGDELVAYENACPHQGGPIGEGIVEGTTVTCPWHAWCFDLRTGFLTLGQFAQLRRFDVHVDRNTIYIATDPEQSVA